MSTKLKVTFEPQDDRSKATEEVKESLRFIEDLKFFLATAPANWQENQVIRRYYLNHDEGFVSCVFWNNLYFITGTDIVRCIVYKFNHFGRKIIDRKKFEEGIFSDLRNLKCDTDAILEPPRSEFLEFLFKNACLRTQKKQKVFFWFNVPHDKLMADALERDLKKEKLGQNPTTIANKEPAKSFKYDENSNLFTQLAEHMESQKKLNEPYPEDPTPTSSTTHVPPSNYKSTPEYTTTISSSSAAVADTTAHSTASVPTNTKDNQPSFLGQETPAQYKANSDYEDDFPLDYFNPNDQGLVNEDYINLDPNYHPGVYGNLIDDNYDAMVDPSIFIQPNLPMSSTTTSNQVAYNDEYLIEQTLPLKTPLQTTSFQQPKSAKFGIPSASDDFFPAFQPLSAKYQTNFPRQVLNVTTPSHTSFPQQMSQANQYYDHSMQSVPYYQHPSDGPVTYNYVRHEPEYWPQPTPSVVYGGGVDQLVQVPVHQSYVLMNDEMVPNNNVYQLVNPNSAQPYVIHPSSQNRQPIQQQQQQQHSLLKNKRQLYQQNKGISKPLHDSDHHRHPKNQHHTLDEVVSSTATKVVAENLKSSDNSIETPPTSSVGHSHK